MRNIKALSFFSLLIILSFTLKAQSDLAAEIMHITDSCAVYVENGRKLIIKNTREGNFAKNIEVIKLLRTKVDEKKYVILFPAEERLVCFIAQNKEAFLSSVSSTNWDNNRIFPPNDQLYGTCIAQLQLEVELWDGWLESQTMNEEEKLVYRLYMGQIGFFNDKQALMKQTNQFLRKYPGSQYSAYIKTLKPVFTSSSFGFNFSMGNMSFGGAAADFASLNGLLNMEADGFTNHFYWSLFFKGSATGRLKIDLEGIDEEGNTTIYHAGKTADYVSGGLKLGYLLYKNRWLKVYPFASISSAKITTYPDDTSLGNLQLTKGTEVGAGLGADFDLLHWKAKNSYGYEPINSHLGIRITTGADKVLVSKKYLGSNSFYASAGIVIWFGD